MYSSRVGSTLINCCPLCATVLTITEIGGRDRLVCVACEFVHWDNPKPVTATLVPIDTGLVLVRRKFEPYINDWCLPGGFIEALEGPEESAIREVEEETGLKVDIDRLLGAFTPGKGINVIILVYLAGNARGEMNPGDDASEVRCFKRDELPKNIAFAIHRNVIKNWFDHKFESGVLRDSGQSS